MKKRLLILLCAVIITASFAGCSSKKEDKENPSALESTEAITETAEETLPPVDPADFYGCWKYIDNDDNTANDEWIGIYPDGKYEIYETMEPLIVARAYQATVEGLYIPEMDSILYFEDGILHTDDGFILEPSTSPHYDQYIKTNIEG